MNSVSSVSTDADLAARYRRVFPSFLTPYYAEPISIDHGSGSYVWTNDGTRYLDFFGGVLTTMIGHDHPEVTAAVQAQAAKVMHTSTLYLSPPMIEFGEMVCAASGIPDARVYFTPSGSEANDAALLLATSYRRSSQVLAVRNSYHGRGFATQAVTSHSSWRSTALSGLQVQFVQGGYRLRSPFRELDDEAYVEACVDDLVQLLDMTSAGDVAAMIAEPIQGVGGFAAPPDGMFGRFAKELVEPRDPVHLRRGADRLGSHRRPLLGLPGARHGARHADLRQGCRQRDHARRSRRPGGDHGLDLGAQLLDVRRQPAVGGGGDRHAASRAARRAAGTTPR